MRNMDVSAERVHTHTHTHTHTVTRTSTSASTITHSHAPTRTYVIRSHTNIQVQDKIAIESTEKHGCCKRVERSDQQC